MLIKILYFYIGTMIGSFLNVVICRLPNQESIIYPRSHCVNCKKMIPFYYNIPIFSYLVLLGKCKECKNKISLQYPLIESITGLTFLFTYINFSFNESIFINIIVSIFICIAIIDYNHFLIPLQLILINFILLLIFCYFFSFSFSYQILGMIIGFIYLCFIFLGTWLFSKKQPMGYGDLLLILLLGLWLGPIKILLSIFLASIIGLIYWMFFSLKDGYNNNLKLPFGTFLIISSILLFFSKSTFDLQNIF